MPYIGDREITKVYDEQIRTLPIIARVPTRDLDTLRHFHSVLVKSLFVSKLFSISINLTKVNLIVAKTIGNLRRFFYYLAYSIYLRPSDTILRIYAKVRGDMS